MPILRSRLLSEKPTGERFPLSLSVSKTKTYLDCAAKFHYCYILKLPRKEYDFHIFGKFLHEILERYYAKVLAECTDAPNLILTAAWREAFGNWKAKLNPEQVKEAKEICMLFLKQLTESNNSTTVLSVEKSFWVDIDGKVLLNGFIDRVQLDKDGILHVSDYKTTKNKKYLKNDYFQLLTYAFVMCLEDPSIQKVRTSYILLRHGFESFVKEFDREEVMKVEDTFLKYAEQIHEEKLYRPNPSVLCKWCDHLEICDAGSKLVGKPISVNAFGVDTW